MNILLSSVGRRVELTRAFRKAFDRIGLQGCILGTDADWLAPALQQVDKACLMPRFNSPDYLRQLSELCKENNIQAIFPLNDGELELLAENSSLFAAAGTHVAGLDAETVKFCSDKWATFDFFKSLGLATPESWLPEHNRTPEFPVFIKPRNGSAAENTFRVDDVEQLAFFSNYVPNPIIQEFLPGAEITSDVVCRCTGEVMSIVSRKRIAVRGGEAIKSVTVHDARIEDACREIAARLKTTGPFTVQCMLKDELPHFLEINGRMGGGLPLAMAAGVDVPALLLSDLAGLPMENLNVKAESGVYMTRCDESFFVSEFAREELCSHSLRP